MIQKFNHHKKYFNYFLQVWHICHTLSSYWKENSSQISWISYIFDQISWRILFSSIEFRWHKLKTQNKWNFICILCFSTSPVGHFTDENGIFHELFWNFFRKATDFSYCNNISDHKKQLTLTLMMRPADLLHTFLL